MIISAVSVISPFGVGLDAFTEGMRSGRSTLSTVDADVPQKQEGLASFEIGDILDEVPSFRVLGRAGSLALGTVGLLQDSLSPYSPGERAVVMGGNLIATDRAMGLTIESLIASPPYQVDTKQFPSSLMNHCAAQTAIRFKMRGPNTTITTGRVTGLSVLGYAKRLHALGRAPMVLAGVVEDMNPRRSWLTWHGHGAGSTDPLGEGCCVFMIEAAEAAAAHGRPALVEVLALEFGVPLRVDGLADALAARMHRALDRAGLSVGDVRTAVVSGPFASDELSAVSTVLGSGTRVLEPASLIGDTDGASAAFQLATAIAHAPPEGELAMVTSVDPDGHVGCGVFRILAQGR
ncbi:hypothetical protein Lesp02_12860 [Lentzea sp. NBRC 105346]|uniref:beta-ketoacyl synthase N-terminal-like domain-containing protein n=1 Tax=Lentzea sp. NBRC 105346 TaxID=3032205 RepID=UPI0024A2BD80|nr:beta-ketoacyl synthase N-terminal-like domain-containing protein [Lentzea sp. NBRC 105346]GLZ29096.1 hypothetical protein Lesp02_12860 [Lentzea sp. NBRC 105346]